MSMYSTWYSDEPRGIYPLSESVLTNETRRAKRLFIISAYYSIDFLEKIFSSVLKSKRSRCSVVCVFNGFSGDRLETQIEELNRLQSRFLSEGFKNVKILLSRGCNLFHTKLFFVENDSGSFVFIGSANASSPGFGRNEEILVKLTSRTKRMLRYIDYVVADSTPLADFDLNTVTTNNLLDFFRSGSIYFKPSSQISFTFSELKLPDWVEERLGNISDRPRNSNPGRVWGPYNLRTALNISESDDEKRMRLTIKPWSIETCYGYWIPRQYSSKVEENLSRKEKRLEKDLLLVKGKIEETGLPELINDYSLYLNEANAILSNNGIEYLITQDEQKRLLDRYKRFLDRVYNKLNDANKRKRLCTPLVSTGMPEIWEDTLAVDDFTYSFYEYIAANLSSNIPQIIQVLNQYLQFNVDSEIDEVQDAFERYFSASDAEWSDDYWFERA